MHAFVGIVIVGLALILVGSISYLFIRYPFASMPWTILAGAFMIVIALASQSLLTPYLSENVIRCLNYFVIGSGLFFCGSGLFLMPFGVPEIGLRVWVGAVVAAAVGLCSVVLSFLDASYLFIGFPDLSALNASSVTSHSSPSSSKPEKISNIVSTPSDSRVVQVIEHTKKGVR